MVIGFALESFVNSALLVHTLPLLSAAGVVVGTLFDPLRY